MDQATFDRLRLELPVRAKNGVDFITSAAIVWLMLAWIWTLLPVGLAEERASVR